MGTTWAGANPSANSRAQRRARPATRACGRRPIPPYFDIRSGWVSAIRTQSATSRRSSSPPNSLESRRSKAPRRVLPQAGTPHWSTSVVTVPPRGASDAPWCSGTCLSVLGVP